MKTRTVYHIIVTGHNGDTFSQYLMATELHLISTFLNDNKSLEISKHKVSINFYNQLFNI